MHEAGSELERSGEEQVHDERPLTAETVRRNTEDDLGAAIESENAVAGEEAGSRRRKAANRYHGLGI